MKRLIKSNKRINKRFIKAELTGSELNFLQMCEDDGRFNKEQLFYIKTGLEKGADGFGFSIEQVDLYADPDFSLEQIDQIIEGFENGLTLEQVKVFAKPEIDWYLMYEIKDAFEKEYSIDEIKDMYEL